MPHRTDIGARQQSSVQCAWMGAQPAWLLMAQREQDTFREYLRCVLVPTSRLGDIIVLDNLSAHKDQESEKLVEQAGAQLRFLPPYSPDLNPIEKRWSKIKTFLRAAKARTEDELHQAIGLALETVTPQDAEGWFRSCRYTAPQP